MTYEEKMLEIFAAYRGRPLSTGLVAELEARCREHVWRHLPPEILQTWRLHLAQNEEGGIELRPEQIGKGNAADLENALRSEFQERKQPTGGIAGVNVDFNGGGGSAPDPVSKTSSPGQSVARFGVGEGLRAEDPSSEEETASPSASEPKSPTTAEKPGAPPTQGSEASREIEQQAKELGISLPPNSSLLGPFLEALAAAVEYKHRAEHAESKLAELVALVGK